MLKKDKNLRKGNSTKKKIKYKRLRERGQVKRFNRVKNRLEKSKRAIHRERLKRIVKIRLETLTRVLNLYLEG